MIVNIMTCVHVFIINISVFLMDFNNQVDFKIHQNNTDIYYKDMHVCMKENFAFFSQFATLQWQ